MSRPATAEVVHFYLEGNLWCAVRSDFVDLQASLAGFGGTQPEALVELLKAEVAMHKKGHPVTAKDGLLWRDGEVIPLPEADDVARAAGFACAEQMVRSLKGESDEGDTPC